MSHHLSESATSSSLLAIEKTTISIPEYNNQNFTFREKLAYTEDNVLIYNIIVYGIPKLIAEDDVRQYFSNFGKVIDVKLLQSNRRYRRKAQKVGFVNFAEPESACSVLRKKEQRLQGLRIGVNAACSWNQPNADKVCGPTKSEDNVASTLKGLSIDATTTNDGMHILSLNDDCIETIFGYLGLKEQVRMARSCKRFEDIFQMICKRKFKNLELSKISEMTLWEQRDFFRYAGENMASLTGTVPYNNWESVVEFISTFCGKLKRIRLDYSDMRDRFLKKLLLGCPQLQALTLRYCYLNDNSMKTIAQFNCLEILDIGGNFRITGKYISKMVQLKLLNMCNCWNIETSHLMDICKSLPHLRSLDIEEVGCPPATLLDVIVEHCKELEILKMSCVDFPYERVALLPRLKQLELFYGSFPDTAQKRLLTELVAHKANQLEVLNISTNSMLNAPTIDLISELKQLKTLLIPNNPLVNDDALNKFCKLQQLEKLKIYNCSNITNQGLLKLVKSCPRLNDLDIQYCTQITIDFLLKTISFLKASGNRKKPLVLTAYSTSMCYHDAIVYKEYIEAEEQSLICAGLD